MAPGRDPSALNAKDTAVYLCLQRIVTSPSFRSSNRPKQFLTFVVERALAGRQDEIKERTIGAEIFGRAADFETSGDSIVRVNANEVRKRLAQYYREAPGDDPVRISLPSGTYVPEFTFLKAGEEIPEALAPAPSSPATLLKRWAPGVILAAAAVFAGIWFELPSRHLSGPLQRFWAPMIAPGSPIIISLPTTNTAQIKPSARLSQEPATSGDYLALTPANLQTFHNWHMSMPVVQATAWIAVAIERAGGTSMIRIGTDLKQDEFRSHPMVAIGSFANPWVKRAAEGLRFTFDRGPTDTGPPSIRDSKQPNRSWTLTSIYPETQTKDYAIVTRTIDPVTHEPFLSLAGLHSFGCQLAAEWVSSDAGWKDFAAKAPSGWEHMNLQVVLESDVIHLTTTRPKIVDSYFWK